MKTFNSYRRAGPWIITLMLALLAAACGGGRDPILGMGGGVATSVIIPGAVCTVASGATIPTVTASNPTSGNHFVTTSTAGVAASGKLITATFSLAMNAASINATSFTLTPLGGVALTPASVAYNASTKVATLTTAAALLANTSYTATINMAAVTTPGAVPLACIYAWTFKTAAVVGTGPAPVNLGLATPMAIASAAGVSNAAAVPPDTNTVINGDVVLDDLNGANLGAEAVCNTISVGAAGTLGLCGGNPPTLNGTVISYLYPNAGVTSGAIKSDLNAAYRSITPTGYDGGTLAGATSLGCDVIGTGGGAGVGLGCAAAATLAPGVYIALNSSIGVTGTLTLDGGGDSNAVFVFQTKTPSTLTTASATVPRVAASQILLTNGAKASNVWWQVGSSATIRTYSIFQGNVLANTSITTLTGATSCGRLLAGAVTTSGAFTFDANNAISAPGNANAPAGCQ